MSIKIIRFVRKLLAPRGSLKREMYYLKYSIDKTLGKINYIYDLPMGPCCYHCAHPELHNLEAKLQRQSDRLDYLQKKTSEV